MRPQTNYLTRSPHHRQVSARIRGGRIVALVLVYSFLTNSALAHGLNVLPHRVGTIAIAPYAQQALASALLLSPHKIVPAQLPLRRQIQERFFHGRTAATAVSHPGPIAYISNMDPEKSAMAPRRERGVEGDIQARLNERHAFIERVSPNSWRRSSNLSREAGIKSATRTEVDNFSFADISALVTKGMKANQARTADISGKFKYLLKAMLSSYSMPPSAHELQQDFEILWEPLFDLIEYLKILAVEQILLENDLRKYVSVTWSPAIEGGICSEIVRLIQEAAEEVGHTIIEGKVFKWDDLVHVYAIWGDLAIDLTAGQYISEFSGRPMVVNVPDYVETIIRSMQIPSPSQLDRRRFSVLPLFLRFRRDLLERVLREHQNFHQRNLLGKPA